MGAILYCGVDVSLRMNRARFVDRDGNEQHRRLSFSNDAPGAAKFLQCLQETALQGNFSEIRVGMEATNHLSWHLAMLLARPHEIRSTPIEVYLFNPKMIKGMKEVYAERRKDDWSDAQAIVDRLRLGEPLPRPFDPDDRYLPLQRFTRHRCHLVRQLVREKNYFLSYLFLKCSTLTRGGPLSSPFRTSVLELITEFHSPEEIAATPLDQLTAFLIQKSRNRIADPRQAALEIQRAAQRAYHLPDKLKDPVNQIMASSLRSIRHLQKEIGLIEEVITSEMENWDNPLLSVPGIGLVYSVGIMAEIGNIHNFAHEEKVAKFAGLTWRRKQSGDFHGEDSKLSRTGNPYLRYYLVEAANRVRMHDLEYKAYFQKKYQESKVHQHKRALVLTARKLVRLVFILLHENRPYIKPGEVGLHSEQKRLPA